MKKPIKQLVTRAWRTYRGGKMLAEFLELENKEDTFYPEDWISSFVEAKNKNYVKNEGITRVLYDGQERLLPEVVTKEDLGAGREDAGVLIKFLDAGERLGIQVHPTKEYAREVFSSSYGKTESWHILSTRECGGEKPCIYIGFKEGITKEKWTELFVKQDINGMLDAMHKIEVKPGDTVLVTGGTPHAIGAGCFLLEVQEPSDYTMRVEKVTVAGDELTQMQIHYGVGEEKMLDCFEYQGCTEHALRDKFFLKEKEATKNLSHIITYDDTPCFALDKIKGNYSYCADSFTTVVITKNGGSIISFGEAQAVKRGDKYFIPANCAVELKNIEALIIYPPKI